MFRWDTWILEHHITVICSAKKLFNFFFLRSLRPPRPQADCCFTCEDGYGGRAGGRHCAILGGNGGAGLGGNGNVDVLDKVVDKVVVEVIGEAVELEAEGRGGCSSSSKGSCSSDNSSIVEYTSE
jgi:hypothetical protein